jgi:hypothetical protein
MSEECFFIFLQPRVINREIGMNLIRFLIMR